MMDGHFMAGKVCRVARVMQPHLKSLAGRNRGAWAKTPYAGTPSGKC
jgi:hypothetical protein